jgi:hypothetical protein
MRQVEEISFAGDNGGADGVPSAGRRADHHGGDIIGERPCTELQCGISRAERLAGQLPIPSPASQPPAHGTFPSNQVERLDQLRGVMDAVDQRTRRVESLIGCLMGRSTMLAAARSNDGLEVSEGGAAELYEVKGGGSVSDEVRRGFGTAFQLFNGLHMKDRTAFVDPVAAGVVTVMEMETALTR